MTVRFPLSRGCRLLAAHSRSSPAGHCPPSRCREKNLERLLVGRVRDEIAPGSDGGDVSFFQDLPPARMRERVAELLELVNLDPAMMRRYPHEFSGGQRQRVVITRALAVNPDFVVCDEPVSALDVRTQEQIVALLGSLQARLGLSYLFIAHDLAIVREVAHKVAVMFRGRIVEMGSVTQVYDAPAHPYTCMLLDAVPAPDPQLQRWRLRLIPPEPRFLDGAGSTCVHGENHAETVTAEWHELAPGHGVSCRYWPRAS